MSPSLVLSKIRASRVMRLPDPDNLHVGCVDTVSITWLVALRLTHTKSNWWPMAFDFDHVTSGLPWRASRLELTYMASHLGQPQGCCGSGLELSRVWVVLAVPPGRSPNAGCSGEARLGGASEYRHYRLF